MNKTNEKIILQFNLLLKEVTFILIFTHALDVCEGADDVSLDGPNVEVVIDGSTSYEASKSN